MLSIVIPTLQKDNRILNLLLDELVICDFIDEIVIIDNSTAGYKYESDKIRVVIPKENLYVNPAWNLGVKECKNEYVGILNDDIIFPKNFFEQVHTFLQQTKNCGIIGLDTICKTPKDNFDNYPSDCEVKFCPIDLRGNCWGSAMFGRKDNFFEIPEEMKIWCGDDYLFKMNIDDGTTNFKIYDVDIKHLHSSTSALPEFDEIKANDVKFYSQIDKTLFFPTKNKKKKKFNLYVPLGAACACSQALRDSNLQFRSYPFDWLWGSSFTDRIKILVNNFENWLNIEDLEKQETSCLNNNKDIYINNRTGIVFNHDFETGTTLQEAFPKVKEKYNRRIDRLFNHIEKSKSVLFVYISRLDERQDLLKKDLEFGYKLLKDRFPETDINILYLYNAREVPFECRRITQITDKITRIDFDYDGYDTEIHWKVNDEPLRKLFKKYKMSINPLTIEHSLKQIFSIKRKRVYNNITKIIITVFGIKISYKIKEK